MVLISSQLRHNFTISITESIAYKFSGTGGLISFSFAEGKSPDTKRDSLAVGFVTQQKDAVLARIESGNSDDYLELELVSQQKMQC